jgi:hypothetical protein
MAQKGFPENPNVGDTFKKGGKTYVFQGDRWVIKGDFAGPNPGTKQGQEWYNQRTKKTYVWDTKTKTWGEKGATSTSTTAAPSTTNPPKKTTTTTGAPTSTSPSTTVPVTTSTVAPTTTTTIPPTTTTVPGTLPGGAPGAEPKDYQSAYVEAQDNGFGYLTSIDKKSRLEFLNMLYAKGFGSTRPTPGGLQPSDIEIAAQFYIYFEGNQKSSTNPTGFVTKDDAYREIQKSKTTTTAGAGKFTPKLDVASAFRQVMQNDLGRAPTDQEVERFYNAYRGLESGGNEPNLQSAAQSQIEETMPGESEASAFSGYANVFEQLMRGA